MTRRRLIRSNFFPDSTTEGACASAKALTEDHQRASLVNASAVAPATEKSIAALARDIVLPPVVCEYVVAPHSRIRPPALLAAIVAGETCEHLHAAHAVASRQGILLR
jgi:hypothetical protein